MPIYPSPTPSVQFKIKRDHGAIREIHTNSPEVDHFLLRVKMTCSPHTWINYAYDLKIFFEIIGKPLDAITRHDCVLFMPTTCAMS